MRKAIPISAALLAVLALSVPPAGAAYGLKGLDVTFTEKDGSPAIEAGKHPFAWTTTVGFETRFDEEIGIDVPDGSTRDLRIVAPPGLVGNPTATPRCTTLEFLAKECPISTQVGVTDVLTTALKPNLPIYNLVPPPGVAAKLGFIVSNIVPVTIEASVNPDPPYNIVGSLQNVSQAEPVYKAVTTLWGVPADPAHNPKRFGCVGECAASLAKKPFLTLPRACTGPLPTIFEARSWGNPGEWLREEVLTHDSVGAPQGFEECGKLGFAPHIAAQPTSKAAEAPSGLDFDLNVTDEGLANPTGTGASDLKKAVVTFPEGVTLNPSQAEGLGVCSEADLARESVGSGPDEGCPEASKVGTVEVQTPLLEDTLHGALYVAKPYENRFGSLIAVYMVIKDPGLGVIVKLAGKVEPDPRTGRLRTIFGEPGNELPQFPLSHVNVHLREGARSPLITPPSCGTYTVEAELTPWADPASPQVTTAGFQITQGVNGGPCPPPGRLPFEPGFQAGTLHNDGGAYSPFYMRLTRRDGDQDMTRFSAKLPRGMVAKLAGTSQCPDAAIAAAGAKNGRQEQASPSCPASSEIGHVLGGAGVGAQLTYVPGKIYLAGPYKGAPLSVVAIVPAVAGPFDVGNVVVREALRIDPRTAEVQVDGAASDPLPHILAGIPLRVRDIRVYVDKPNFTLNPTSCAPFQVGAGLWGGGADPFSIADDGLHSLAVPFRAANCARLGFAPKLALSLKGGTKRGGHPALTGTYAPRAGDANLSGLVLRLPHSAFLDQAHIRTICTRVQFAQKACPEGAIYGHATAYTPLLDQPLEGPVYLRSSDHNLPDFVAALHGLVDVEAVARIDSARGGIRATFSEVPDAPLSKVVVQMQGAKRGLIVNSTNLCAEAHRANAQLSGQNGIKRAARPPVIAAGCGTSKRHHRQKAR